MARIMRIYIVAADVRDKDSYRDYTTLPPEKRSWLTTVREETELKYGEFVSIMGVYGSRDRAEHRVDELDREGFGVFPIVEMRCGRELLKYVGGYAE